MKKRIMIVDDSRVVYLQIKKLLQDTEFEIVEYCQDGESVLQAYENCRPDLVTMDIVMTGMDGLDAARLLIEKWPAARILMVSSLFYDSTIDEARKIGVKGFIYKPLEKDSLLKALGQVSECP